MPRVYTICLFATNYLATCDVASSNDPPRVLQIATVCVDILISGLGEDSESRHNGQRLPGSHTSFVIGQSPSGDCPGKPIWRISTTHIRRQKSEKKRTSNEHDRLRKLRIHEDEGYEVEEHGHSHWRMVPHIVVEVVLHRDRHDKFHEVVDIRLPREDGHHEVENGSDDPWHSNHHGAVENGDDNPRDEGYVRHEEVVLDGHSGHRPVDRNHCVHAESASDGDHEEVLAPAHIRKAEAAGQTNISNAMNIGAFTIGIVELFHGQLQVGTVLKLDEAESISNEGFQLDLLPSAITFSSDLRIYHIQSRFASKVFEILSSK